MIAGSVRHPPATHQVFLPALVIQPYARSSSGHCASAPPPSGILPRACYHVASRLKLWHLRTLVKRRYGLPEIVYLPRSSKPEPAPGIFIINVWEDDSQHEVDVYNSRECHVLKMDVNDAIRTYRNNTLLHTLFVVGGYESKDNWSEFSSKIDEHYKRKYED